MKWLKNPSMMLIFGLLFPGLGCGGPPVLQSEEAHSTADALYTAITSQRIELLDECAADLKELSDSGKISPEAHDFLGTIISKARSGDWQKAAEALDGFIRHQPARHH